MKAHRLALTLVIALLLLTITITPVLSDDREFVFFGFSKYLDGEAPDAVGSNLEVYGILNPAGGLSLPIALDPDNFQYTIYIASMTVTSYSNEPDYLKTLTYDSGEIRIYADATTGGTAAAYVDRATFTDGELIFLATLDSGFIVKLFDFDGDQLSNGYGSGECDLHGGSQLEALTDVGYFLDDWGIYATIADPGSGPGLTVPDGFHRLFDVVLTPPNDLTARKGSTWGKLKRSYRRSAP
jgi:hypothetical protein